MVQEGICRGEKNISRSLTKKNSKSIVSLNEFLAGGTGSRV
jgi:hypothetical protein